MVSGSFYTPFSSYYIEDLSMECTANLHLYECSKKQPNYSLTEQWKRTAVIQFNSTEKKT